MPGGDGFRAIALARIVEPASSAEVVQVLEELAAPAVSVRTLFRPLARSQALPARGAPVRDNKAETTTLSSVLTAFACRHDVRDIHQ